MSDKKEHRLDDSLGYFNPLTRAPGEGLIVWEQKSTEWCNLKIVFEARCLARMRIYGRDGDRPPADPFTPELDRLCRKEAIEILEAGLRELKQEDSLDMMLFSNMPEAGVEVEDPFDFCETPAETPASDASSGDEDEEKKLLARRKGTGKGKSSGCSEAKRPKLMDES